MLIYGASKTSLSSKITCLTNTAKGRKNPRMMIGMMQGLDVHPLVMELWRNWDLSESNQMERLFSGMSIHGTTVSRVFDTHV